MTKRVNYEAVAPSYDRRYVNNEYPGTCGVLESMLHGRPGLRALEVACGTGHWLGTMLELGAQVAGLDASAGMLERARERLPEVELTLGSAEQLPWPDASFDLVLANNAVHHFPDVPGFIAEAHRVLKPDGRLLIIGLEPDAVRHWAIYEYFAGTRERDRERYPAAKQLQTYMKQAGFVGCEARPVEHLLSRNRASEALDRGLLDQHLTSQLSLLSTAAYQSGLQLVRDARAASEQRGEDLWLETDLTLYGTIGTRG